jgi:hypothetical protein
MFYATVLFLVFFSARCFAAPPEVVSLTQQAFAVLVKNTDRYDTYAQNIIVDIVAKLPISAAQLYKTSENSQGRYFEHKETRCFKNRIGYFVDSQNNSCLLDQDENAEQDAKRIYLNHRDYICIKKRNRHISWGDPSYYAYDNHRKGVSNDVRQIIVNPYVPGQLLILESKKLIIKQESNVQRTLDINFNDSMIFSGGLAINESGVVAIAVTQRGIPSIHFYDTSTGSLLPERTIRLADRSLPTLWAITFDPHNEHRMFGYGSNGIIYIIDIKRKLIQALIKTKANCTTFTYHMAQLHCDLLRPGNVYAIMQGSHVNFVDTLKHPSTLSEIMKKEESNNPQLGEIIALDPKPGIERIRRVKIGSATRYGNYMLGRAGWLLVDSIIYMLLNPIPTLSVVGLLATTKVLQRYYFR